MAAPATDMSFLSWGRGLGVVPSDKLRDCKNNNKGERSEQTAELLLMGETGSVTLVTHLFMVACDDMW